MRRGSVNEGPDRIPARRYIDKKEGVRHVTLAGYRRRRIPDSDSRLDGAHERKPPQGCASAPGGVPGAKADWIKETRPKFNNGNAARSLHICLAGCGTIACAFRGRRAPADPPAGARPTLVFILMNVMMIHPYAVLGFLVFCAAAAWTMALIVLALRSGLTHYKRTSRVKTSPRGA